MKVYLLDCPNTLNYGSMMMAENFIYYFSRELARKWISMFRLWMTAMANDFGAQRGTQALRAFP
jgi:hypothetical protein